MLQLSGRLKETKGSGAEATVERKWGRTYEGLSINDAEGVLLLTASLL